MCIERDVRRPEKPLNNVLTLNIVKLRLTKPMARARPIFYEVRESKKGFKGKHWKVTAYIDGKRKQHWCASEKEAKIALVP
jgi:hypothetical protein